jgi:hypothetical protein
MNAANWGTPADLRAQVERLWRRGDLLRALAPDSVAAAAIWPLRLRLKRPSSADVTERFEAVRAWVAELAAMPYVRIEWRAIRHRVQGRQNLPAAAWVASPDDAFALIGKRREAKTWGALRAQTQAELPALLPWLARRPLQALALAPSWAQLLSVTRWILAHPCREQVYLRQVDAPGIDSKFIERHRAVLAELLDGVLPEEAIDPDAPAGVRGFARRYGFRDKPTLIRFRLLDPALCLFDPALKAPSANPAGSDMTLALDAENFAALGLPLRRVFITENEINFLSFPPVAESIVIFGKGYGWEALARAKWLFDLPLHYWGDIDTHGFAILDQLRESFPRARSFLMDRKTLLAHESYWGHEPEPARHDLPRLTNDERALYDELRDNRLREHLRLEQERVRASWLAAALSDIEEKIHP